MIFCPSFCMPSKGGFTVTTQRAQPARSTAKRQTIPVLFDQGTADHFTPRLHDDLTEPQRLSRISNTPDDTETQEDSLPELRKVSGKSYAQDTSDNDLSENEEIGRKSSAGRKTIGDLVGINNKKNIQAKRRPVIYPPLPVDTKDLQYEKFPKDESTAKQISNAIMNNDFLKNLMDDYRLSSVVEAMSPKECAAGERIINEGESGSHLYVSAHGHFEVLKGNKVVKTFGAGEVFGELAILYKAKRFASIQCVTDSKIWTLERRVFQKIMVRSGQQELEDNIRFLHSVPLLQGIDRIELTQISGFLKREFFSTGTVIVRQGDRGDKFYIIRGGRVVVTKKDGDEEREIAILHRGKYFGEQALLHEDRRLATVTALAPGAECLTLERGPFTTLLGGLDELVNIVHTDPSPARASAKPKAQVKSEYDYVELKDLQILGTLGVGGFGRVELVRYKPKKNITFALKCLKKIEMVQQQQQEHAYNEKNIMMMCDSPFLCKLYRTYKDNKFIYFLMEPVLGGDLWTLLQKRSYFQEPVAKFMSACVVEAFLYLHSKNIVYRDLKPENLMLDKHGYVKLVDFGFAKLVTNNQQTWTFAGTPEYVAPEIVLNKGHDRAVDCWALGVFIYELLVGRPPFRAPGGDHMKTYNLILAGIDTVRFHPRVKPAPQHLITKLCRPIPVERLGYLKNGMTDVKNHKWFNGFQWKDLRERKLSAPLIPQVANDSDLSNFEKYQSDMNLPPDETSGWDVDF